jgi:hypothetical protein
MWKEVADHNKQLDATALKVLKTIFSAADNTARCGEQDDMIHTLTDCEGAIYTKADLLQES